jgi:hypothetical protein
VYNVSIAFIYSVDDPQANDLAVENNGFGNHVWDILVNNIPQLFFWC